MTETQYKNFQIKLKSNKVFRWFWQFWAIYSFAFFAAAFGFIYSNAKALSLPWEVIFINTVIAFFIARVLIVTLINLLYKRKRPYQKFNFSPITSIFFSYKTHHHNSFPSRHTSAYVAAAVVVFMFIPQLGLGLIAVSLLAGAGRVVLGYHWPSDIIAGAFLGAVVGFFTVILMSLPVLF
jgi:membrane-associated phospholipid phosphatase